MKWLDAAILSEWAWPQYLARPSLLPDGVCVLAEVRLSGDVDYAFLTARASAEGLASHVASLREAGARVRVEVIPGEEMGRLLSGGDAVFATAHLLGIKVAQVERPVSVGQRVIYPQGEDDESEPLMLVATPFDGAEEMEVMRLRLQDRKAAQGHDLLIASFTEAHAGRRTDGEGVFGALVVGDEVEGLYPGALGLGVPIALLEGTGHQWRSLRPARHEPAILQDILLLVQEARDRRVLLVCLDDLEWRVREAVVHPAPVQTSEGMCFRVKVLHGPPGSTEEQVFGLVTVS